MSKEKDYEIDSYKLDEEEIMEPLPKVYPCVPLRGVSIFPDTVIHFDIGRDKSVRALEAAMADDKLIFVSSQKDENILIPTFSDIYNVGTIVKVKQMLKINGDVVRVLVEGIRRAKLDTPISEEGYMSCTLIELPMGVDELALSVEEKAAMRILTDKFIEYAALTNAISDEVVDKVLKEKDPSALVDKMANELAVSCARKQLVLEAEPFYNRINQLIAIISEENDIAVMEKQLAQKVKESVDNNQKEYFLKERMKVIQEELGEDEDPTQEADAWLAKLDELKLDEIIDTKIRKEIKRFSRMSPSSAESSVIRNYVETILELPWHKSSKVNTNLNRASKILERDHYGLKHVKERVLEYLAVIHLSKAIKGPILCLVGPPGTGKTSIARSIAESTGREFVRMSLGGVRDEAEIRGHRRTYIGAIPGRIMTSMKEIGVNNPVFLFDEIDKVGADYKGDPSSALLEVLDPEQNNTFTDHFLEIPFDLSNVLFITTANTLDTIPRPLLDRMEVIQVSGYTEEEKSKIAEKYLIPKKVKEHGLKKDAVKVSPQALSDIINYYTRESGVRNLEREIANICRKAAYWTVTTKKKNFTVTPRNLEKFLGKKKYHYDTIQGKSEVGVVNGMAWTQVGGDTLSIEVAILQGTGKLTLTGQMGDVMQESAKAGVSYIRAISSELGIDPEFQKEKDIHIHIPEGAVPKDGPSAGVTMFTAVVSALTGIPVKQDVAMTGEITLRGKVLPVGGIKEKVLAAHRAGVTKILLPRENLKDVEEIPASVRKQLTFVPLDYANEALKEALEEKSKGTKKINKK
ncbi:MAG: endopeptidase La [Firmicutes bacterium]|nr:endopeptidase La [Bacillota bacterium]